MDLRGCPSLLKKVQMNMTDTIVKGIFEIGVSGVQHTEIRLSVFKTMRLKFTAEEMTGDRELSIAAVAQDWRALEFVSQEMKGDRELCAAAVAQNWRAWSSSARR